MPRSEAVLPKTQRNDLAPNRPGPMFMSVAESAPEKSPQKRVDKLRGTP